MNEIFLIINETTFIGTDQITSEVVRAFDNFDAASYWLENLAEKEGIDFDPDGSSVYVNPKRGVETDEYYIHSMEVHRG